MLRATRCALAGARARLGARLPAARTLGLRVQHTRDGGRERLSGLRRVRALPAAARVSHAGRHRGGHLRARPGEGGDGRPGQRRRLSARQQSKRSRPLRRPVQAPPWLGAQPAGRAAQQRAWRGRGPHASSSTTTASASTPARRAARSKKSSTATASPLANCQTRTAPSAGAISRLPLQPPQPCP